MARRVVANRHRGRPLNSVVRLHVKTIAEVVPKFASEVAGALVADGHAKGEPPPPGQPSVAQTIPFAAPHWFNVDIAQDGGIFGIEILGRSDVIGQLRAARAI